MGVIIISSKPSRLLDWINDDSASKYTQPSGGEQLAGHINDTPADPKVFNFCWWRLSQWTEYLDELELNQIADSSDYKKVKTEDLTVNRVDFDKLDGVTTTKTEVNQLSGVDVGGNLTGDILTTDDTQTLENKTLTSPKLNEDVVLSTTATELNLLDGVTGLVQADFTKLAAIDADATEINQLDGVTVGGSSAGDIVTLNATQTLTNKTIDADNNTISNLEHGAEVDEPTDAHGVAGVIVGTDSEQTLTLKTLTSPKINENVVLTSTSTEIDNVVASGITLDKAINGKNITEELSGSTIHGRLSWEKDGISMYQPARPSSTKILSIISERVKYGNATSSATDKLIDSGGGFSGIVNVGDIVLNTDDDNSTTVVGIDSDIQLDLNDDIFDTGDEAYEIFTPTTGDINIGKTGSSLNYDNSAETLQFTGDIQANSTLPTGGSAIVAQSNIKTSLPAEVSYTGDAGGSSITLPGGEYGFYPQIRMQVGTTGATAYIGENFSNTTFVTNIYLEHNTGSSKSVYAQQRYITSSGEIYWIFLLRDKITKDIICTYFACDHPCFGNGNDPDVVQHPFPDYDSSIHEIIVLLPNEEELDEIDKKRGWKNGAPKKELYEVLKQLYDIDDTEEPEWPAIDITVGLNKERTKPVKVKINKPSFIKTAKLKKKEE